MDIPRPPASRRLRRRHLGAALAVAALALVTLVAAGRLRPAAPSVSRAAVWTDTVKRGPLVREVRAPGTLVPEKVRWVAAVSGGRVERVLAAPGTAVEAETVLLELSNPDIELEALEAERELAGAEAGLVNLRSTLANQCLNQEAAIAALRSEHSEAKRKAAADQVLAANGLIAGMERSRSAGKAAELATRLEIEEKRLAIARESMQAQLALEETRIVRLRATTAFHRRRVEAMRVRARAAGVLQDMALEVGQWVAPGTTLARVVEPGHLKAVLRVPATQARDIAPGMGVAVDTRRDVMRGRVTRVDPGVQDGTVAVEVALEAALPASARPNLAVDATIQIERLDDVLFAGCPAGGASLATLGLFKLAEGGASAERVTVKLGRGSTTAIEILEGLQEGDQVILSDMSAWDAVDRIRLK